MKLSVKEMVIFSMLASIMYVSKIIMDSFPNIHLIGTLTIAYTLVYRKKALYIIYTFVFITGLFNGFGVWWIPYLYIWTILWGMTMLLPKNIPNKFKPIVYMILCASHGFLYGILYAPSQALLFGLDFNGMIAWIMSGLYFDLIHGISNFMIGTLILPIVNILQKVNKA